MKVLTLRPHHVLCLLHYSGHGYSDAFTENMTQVAGLLRAEPDVLVQLLSSAEKDVLCSCCPNRRGAVCVGEKPARYDDAVLQHSGLQQGQRFSWAELCRRMRPLSLQYRQGICADCHWNALCAAAESTWKDNN